MRRYPPGKNPDCQRASDLRLGAIHHEKLIPEIISGGIPSNVLAELQNAQLPALKR